MDKIKIIWPNVMRKTKQHDAIRRGVLCQIYLGRFLGIKILTFDICGEYQKKDIFSGGGGGGMNIFVDIFIGTQLNGTCLESRSF